MKRLFRFTLLFLCLASAAAGRAQSGGIAGTWNGILRISGAQLRIVLRFAEQADGRMACTMESPDQGAKGIPLTIDSLSERFVAVSSRQLALTYFASCDAKQLHGTFQQGSLLAPLTFERGEAAADRPQEPKAPFPYTAEEVVFLNPADSARLSGTLTHAAPGTAPSGSGETAVVLVSGSGLQNRDEEVCGHRPFAVIADRLARHGIASLRYDDRGCGQSAGAVAQATTRTFQADAAAAVDWLRRSGRYARIGVIGHSEGGQIACLLAAEGRADFVVSLAGPVTTGDSILLYQNRAILARTAGQATADAYCTALAEVLTLLADAPQPFSAQEATARVQQIVTEKRLAIPAPLTDNLVQVLRSDNAWLKAFIRLDIRPLLPQIRVPLFAAAGALDRQVPAEQTIAALARLLPKAANLRQEYKVYPGLNHLFQHASTGFPDEYGTLSETLSEELLHDLVTFIHTAF